METNHLPNRETVFCKTIKGLDEIAHRMHDLNSRQRRILILIDGHKSIAALSQFLPQQELDDIIPFLVREGFVEAQDDSSPFLPLHAGITNEPVDDSGLRETKDFMISVAHSCLGLLASDVIRRIEHVEHASQLDTVIGYWMAALRDSKFGSHLAERYLEQLKKTLPPLRLQ